MKRDFVWWLIRVCFVFNTLITGHDAAAGRYMSALFMGIASLIGLVHISIEDTMEAHGREDLDDA